MKPLNLEASGTYQIVVRDKDGKIKYESPEFKNLIVDQGIDRFMANTQWHDWGFCGTGNATPTVGDVGLQSFLAETNSFGDDISESTYATPRYHVLKRTYDFAVGAVVGNVAEVGVGWKVGATRLVFSRSLVVDGGGTPTTITILASEQLTIIYRFYVKVPDADTTFNVTDNAITYTVTARQLFRADYNSFRYLYFGFWGNDAGNKSGQVAASDVLPPISGSFAAGDNATSINLGAYVNGSFTRSINFGFGGSVGNFPGGIGSMCAFTGDGVGQWVFGLSPKINKISGQSLTLSFNYNFVRGTPP